MGQFSIGLKFTGKEALDHSANFGAEGQKTCFLTEAVIEGHGKR